MAEVKYKGGLGHTYRTVDYKVKEGRSVEVSDEEAKRLTTTWPDAFELVGKPKKQKADKTRKVDEAPKNRMRSKPNTNRGAAE